MLDEIYFLDKNQVSLYLVNGSKIYLSDCYWQVTQTGTEKRDVLTDELLDCITIDEATNKIWGSKEICKVNLD